MSPNGSIWCANAGRKYHALSPDWGRSGLGLCGRSIARPSYTFTYDAAFVQAFRAGGRDPEQSMCRDCVRRMVLKEG
jgi:hypothetical protein